MNGLKWKWNPCIPEKNGKKCQAKPRRKLPENTAISVIYTAWKVSIFGVILVRIQSESEKIRTRITPNTDTFNAVIAISKLFHGGGPYYVETNPLICSADQWTGFYMIRTSVMKELNEYYFHNTYCWFCCSDILSLIKDVWKPLQGLT